jgi:hypothetical protein
VGFNRWKEAGLAESDLRNTLYGNDRGATGKQKYGEQRIPSSHKMPEEVFDEKLENNSKVRALDIAS